LKFQRPLALSENAIAIAQERSKSSKARFGVTIDVTGMVWLDTVVDANVRELVATVTRASDPDWLEDELRSEWDARNKRPLGSRHRLSPSRRLSRGRV
jgi:hypothetical protein